MKEETMEGTSSTSAWLHKSLLSAHRHGEHLARTPHRASGELELKRHHLAARTRAAASCAGAAWAIKRRRRVAVARRHQIAHLASRHLSA